MLNLASPKSLLIQPTVDCSFDPTSTGLINTPSGTRTMTLRSIIRDSRALMSEATDLMLECQREYTGLISCQPSITSLARAACYTADEARRGMSEDRLTLSDADGICQRCTVITRSIQAEMSHLSAQTARDWSRTMASYLRDQANFHRLIATYFDQAVAAF
ncbi:unnamed protein product [Protopolystoma xenopodis]|uniref:Sorting nexin protein WASP-binding domain-containing protein n=1 Tax=Protopolystoma xenopodis TaxID=117903 RepID=A0A3S4ZN80_9PLAT|nr:unnamed protein product [Protopolystoma xenopodis]